MKPATTALIGIAAIILVALAISVYPPPRDTGVPVPVTIAAPSFELSAPVYIAEERGIFAKNGLNVTIRDYQTGKASLDAVLAGNADLAIPAEFVIAGNAFAHTNVSAIACIDKSTSFSIIVRNDRGIANPGDLRGKRIGLVRKTSGEFIFGRYLEIHGLNMSDVIVVDETLPGAVESLAGGDTDAIVVPPPYSNQIMDRLGGNATAWPAQGGQPVFQLLVGRNDWIARNPDAVDRLIRSLDQADAYFVSDPENAKKIVQDRLGFSPQYMDTAWPQNQFSLSLDPSLLATLEDEGRWMIRNNLVNATQIPDYRNYLYSQGLDTVKPGSVNIIR
jgi:NitT/TauT family transport system substrate-binding protein